MTSLNPKQLRQILGSFATGVTVVTSAYEGQQRGMTVNSFTSVSLDPPLVLYCSTEGSTLQIVKKSGVFALNILGSEQLDIARRFAGQTQLDEHERFTDLDCRTGLGGSPLLNGALARLQCRVRQFIPGGDHEIVLAEVVEAEMAEGSPLLFYRGQFPKLNV